VDLAARRKQQAREAGDGRQSWRGTAARERELGGGGVPSRGVSTRRHRCANLSPVDRSSS
jgi:hypothetical protein